MSIEMGERVRQRRESLELTQVQLAAAVGCSQPMIKKIEAGSRTSLGRRLAEALGVSLEWLETGREGEGPNGNNHSSANAELSKKSHISGMIAASPSAPRSRIDEPLESNVGEELELKAGRAVAVVGEVQGGPDGYISIDDYPVGQGHGWVQVYTADPSAYGLRVRGDSMRPRIKSGEHIVVEPGIEAQPGDDVVVKFVDGSAVVKELLWTRDDEICLGSINNGIPPITRPIATVLSIHRVAAIVPRGSGMYRTEL